MSFALGLKTAAASWPRVRLAQPPPPGNGRLGLGSRWLLPAALPLTHARRIRSGFSVNRPTTHPRQRWTTSWPLPIKASGVDAAAVAAVVFRITRGSLCIKLRTAFSANIRRTTRTTIRRQVASCFRNGRHVVYTVTSVRGLGWGYRMRRDANDKLSSSYRIGRNPVRHLRYSI